MNSEWITWEDGPDKRVGRIVKITGNNVTVVALNGNQVTFNANAREILLLSQDELHAIKREHFFNVNGRDVWQLLRHDVIRSIDPSDDQLKVFELNRDLTADGQEDVEKLDEKYRVVTFVDKRLDNNVSKLETHYDEEDV